MNSQFRNILILGLLVLTVSCSKDPNVPITEELEFTQCLRPIQVKHSVLYVSATITMTTFPDAEKYELNVTAIPLATSSEPDRETWTWSTTFLPSELPYTFTAPDECSCTYQLRAINETKGKIPSEWVSGTFKTDVDPETVCGTPSSVKANALYNRVTFSWVANSNVEDYIIELYSSAIPSSGEPNAANLVQSYTKKPSEVPFTIVFDQEASFWFRIRGVNPTAGLKPSKWVSGAFKTRFYSWPNDEVAFDYNLSTAREANYALAGLSSGTGVTGDPITTTDQITYGPSMTFYGDRFYMNRCKKFDDKSYPVAFPQESYISLRVNKPGSLSFRPRSSGKPEVVLGLLTKKNGETSFKYVYCAQPENISNSKVEANRLTIEVSEEDLFGMDESATLYLFCNVIAMQVYPLRWTPAI